MFDPNADRKRRSIAVSFRLTDDEYAALVSLAKTENEGQVSDAIRCAIADRIEACKEEA